MPLPKQMKKTDLTLASVTSSSLFPNDQNTFALAEGLRAPLFCLMLKYTKMKQLLPLIFLFAANTLHAGGVYQTQEDFLAEVFAKDAPKPQVLWPDKSLNKKIVEILGHKYKSLRIRYWKKENRTAWVLEEIRKEKLITTGFVIKDQKIERVRVLIFRESRGWEVRHTFFTEQFDNASLKKNQDMELDRNIDNISGATLSVRAVTKLARLALLLDEHADAKKN